MAWVEVTDYTYPGGWNQSTAANEKAREYCRQLEAGKILFFRSPPFPFPDADRSFLLGQRQSTFKSHKNISYRPKTDELRGAAAESAEDSKRLQEIMRAFSRNVTEFLGSFLIPYASKRLLDFASYRPIEEQNRDLPTNRRNDLLHVDAFPTRPTNGGRILRIFTNINPTEDRVWNTTAPIEVIAQRYAKEAGLEKMATPTAAQRVQSALAPLLKTVGIKGADRSPYDRFMLHFHDWLKFNSDYQTNFPKEETAFPPNSSWMVYTDTVPHAVMRGKCAIEQTFVIPADAMVAPETSPIKVLEGIAGRSLAS